jgi:predicted glycosyltransferase
VHTDQPKPDLKILIAPLDWGLGHATRCIPIIRYLLQNNCLVTIAGEGAVATILKSNFPELEILPLQGYRIGYSNTAAGFATKILIQIPKILRAIKAEREWLKRIQSQYNFNLILSDNRYGLKIKGTPSVIMTHQLQIQSGTGKLTDRLLKWLHYSILEKFDGCWIVDHEGENNLGGTLSHPDKLPSNGKYIGLLSQLNLVSNGIESNPDEILVLLSGPEPMRGILEKKILAQLATERQYHFNMVAGNPAGSLPDNLPDHVTYHTHVNAANINDFMQKAALVICRSGYSTLMDLAVVGKKALLIPTPGQAEQEYLGKKLLDHGVMLCRNQSTLNLPTDIIEALNFPGFQRTENQNDFRIVVDDVLDKLRRHSNTENLL